MTFERLLELIVAPSLLTESEGRNVQSGSLQKINSEIMFIILKHKISTNIAEYILTVNNNITSRHS